MDLRYTADELRFATSLRAFVDDHLPDDIRERMRLGTRAQEDIVACSASSTGATGSAYSWPKELWRSRLTPVPAHDLPRGKPAGAGARGVVVQYHDDRPVLTPVWQRGQTAAIFAARLPNIDDWWCPGFFRAGAGSDLDALKTAAKRDGTIMSSTARRSGPRRRITPIGAFAWCVPIPTRNARKTFRFCWST